MSVPGEKRSEGGRPTPPPRPDGRAGASAAAFTGERPGWGEDFDYDYSRHVAAYHRAASLVAGKRVMDAGCGEGFGTSTLAPLAREVVGVDYSSAAVAECRRLWCGPSAPNLRFEQVDLTRPGDFDERFDVVLSFQVLEHIRDSTAFLRSLRDRLAPGGLLMLTTPNRLRSASGNPYHVREYTAEELAEELGRVFPHVDLRGVHGNEKVEEFEVKRARAVRRILRLDPFGLLRILPQRLIEFAYARLAAIVRRQAKATGAPPIVPEDFRVSGENLDHALDFVAICRVDPDTGGASS